MKEKRLQQLAAALVQEEAAAIAAKAAKDKKAATKKKGKEEGKEGKEEAAAAAVPAVRRVVLEELKCVEWCLCCGVCCALVSTHTCIRIMFSLNSHPNHTTIYHTNTHLTQP